MGLGAWVVAAPAHADCFDEAAKYQQVNPLILRAIAWQESHNHPDAMNKNANGSIDVFFGPAAPPGKKPNWIPTRPDGAFEVLFRFYGPEKPLFEKTWALPDIEKLT